MTQSNKSNRDYRMPFGKYKGSTLEEIYVDDREYLEWCADTLDKEDIRERIADAIRDLDAHLRIG